MFREMIGKIAATGKEWKTRIYIRQSGSVVIELPKSLAIDELGLSKKDNKKRYNISLLDNSGNGDMFALSFNKIDG